MGKDLIKLPNDKRGFLILLVLEALIAVWALTATFYAITRGRARTAVYGAITLFAVFYILGRSLRVLVGILKKEKDEKNQSGDRKK